MQFALGGEGAYEIQVHFLKFTDVGRVAIRFGGRTADVRSYGVELSRLEDSTLDSMGHE